MICMQMFPENLTCVVFEEWISRGIAVTRDPVQHRQLSYTLPPSFALSLQCGVASTAQVFCPQRGSISG